MTRALGILLAAAVAAAIVSHGAPPAEAAKKKAKKAGDGAALSASDLADWQANYGTSSNKRKRVKRFRPQ